MAEIIIQGNRESLSEILALILARLESGPILDYSISIQTKGLDPAYGPPDWRPDARKDA